MITTARFARENNIPYLGICLGMQVALIDYARHVANMENANSTEFVPDCKYPVVALITEWRDENGNVEVRSEKSDLGGTMRLGAQQCQLVDDSLVRQLYNAPTIVERHRHRYEVNNMLLKQIEDAGLRVAGRSGDDQLVEIIEVPNHPWFVACQFHPEFTSTPRDGHPLFAGFVKENHLGYAEEKSIEILKSLGINEKVSKKVRTATRTLGTRCLSGVSV